VRIPSSLTAAELLVLRRPFVKRFALCYGTVVLSVTLVCYGQPVGWIMVPLGMEVGLGPVDIVLDVTHLSHGQCLLCQTAEWIRIPLGTDVCFGRLSQQLLNSCYVTGCGYCELIHL